MHLPSISVVVPVRNQELFIGRCIRSLLNQTLPRSEFEIVVVDDASEDRTRYALGLFGDDVRVLHNETRRGLPASLNDGLRNSKGRFVVRVDGDDYVHSEYLNVLSLHLTLNPTMDAIACDYHVVSDGEQILETRSCIESPIGCGIMFRIDHLVQLGLYDESFSFREDAEMRIRFLKEHTIQRVALPLYRYRRHSNNMTNDHDAMAEFTRNLVSKHGEEASTL